MTDWVELGIGALALLGAVMSLLVGPQSAETRSLAIASKASSALKNEQSRLFGVNSLGWFRLFYVAALAGVMTDHFTGVFVASTFVFWMSLNVVRVDLQLCGRPSQWCTALTGINVLLYLLLWIRV